MPFYTGEKNFFFTLFLGCAARGTSFHNAPRTPRTCLMLPICATTSCPGRNLLCFVMRALLKSYFLHSAAGNTLLPFSASEVT